MTPAPPGRRTQRARKVIRRYVAHSEIDRPLYPDSNRMHALVKSGEFLDNVGKAYAA